MYCNIFKRRGHAFVMFYSYVSICEYRLLAKHSVKLYIYIYTHNNELKQSSRSWSFYLCHVQCLVYIRSLVNVCTIVSLHFHCNYIQDVIMVLILAHSSKMPAWQNTLIALSGSFQDLAEGHIFNRFKC